MNRLILLCAAAVALAMALQTAVAGDAPKPQPVQAPPAEEARPSDEEAQIQLRQNLRQMRTLFEQEDAQSEAAARAYTQSLQISTPDMPGIGAMREQLSRQFERLEDRCFGMDAKVNGGNLIVICGDNSGRAENANIDSGNSTTVIVPPLPPQPAPQAQKAAEGQS